MGWGVIRGQFAIICFFFFFLAFFSVCKLRCRGFGQSAAPGPENHGRDCLERFASKVDGMVAMWITPGGGGLEILYWHGE